MVNRCDSVDALMYAYYAFMKNKEENQMLEKNKDYIEMRVSSTDCAFTQNAATTISIEGFSYDKSFRFPDPGESYVIVSKEKFEKLQESVVYYMALSTRAQYWKDKCEQLQFDLVHYKELARQWESNYGLLLEKTGFTSVEDLIDYICDPSMTSPEDKTLKEIIDECEKDYISERDKAEALEKEIGIYSRTLNEWKEGTGCPSPSAAKTLIESGMSYVHGYHEAQKENQKLTEEVDSWKNTTGYSTPEDYMHVRINNATPFDYTAAWQDATGCVTPDQVKSRIEGLENAVRLTNRNMIKEIESNIDEWQKFTGCDSPQKAGCKINDLCDEICKLKGDYDHLLELTGYKNEKGICAALVFSDENHLYITMRDLINSLKRKAKFTESNWQKATGCDTPEKAQCKITDLYNRIDKMKEAASIASNWTDKIVED